ncbi:MAG TPA: hypothetical protein VKZ59_03710 [Acidobacteriota bacterium]|nr:hypothetical protein [Acidobacteriota bacterium]
MAKAEDKKIFEAKRSIGRLQRRVGALEAAIKSSPDFYFLTPTVPIPPPYKGTSDVASETTADGFLTFEGCDDFFENTTDQMVTKTVTIRNEDEDFSMTVDIDGKEITRIDPGKCKTFVVTIPAGKSLHADRNGRYRPES